MQPQFENDSQNSVEKIMVIPIFEFAGMILYTFIQFHSTPAIVTSVFIGLGIVFCGCAMVHNVFVWQKVSTLESAFFPGSPSSALPSDLLPPLRPAT